MEGRGGGGRNDRVSFVEGEYDNRFRYVRGESNAGFIYYCQGKQRFFSIWAKADNPNYFPINCNICDSNKGLLLCHCPSAPVSNAKRKRTEHAYSSTYTVCNPFLPKSQMRHIRKTPNRLHPDCIPRALVVPSHQLGPAVFHIVCALPANNSTHTYSFEVYSSGTNEWTISAPHDVLGRIRKDTGVSCGTRAYWLLEGRPSALFYDTAHDSVDFISLPPSYAALLRQPDVQLRWQLGRVGSKLYFVVAKEHWRAVYAYHDDGNSNWECNHERTYAYAQLPMLPRFEDGRLQVPFWFDSRVFVLWDHCWYGVEPHRTVYLEGPHRDLGADVLPLVHTQINPLQDSLTSCSKSSSAD